MAWTAPVSVEDGTLLHNRAQQGAACSGAPPTVAGRMETVPASAGADCRTASGIGAPPRRRLIEGGDGAFLPCRAFLTFGKMPRRDLRRGHVSRGYVMRPTCRPLLPLRWWLRPAVLLLARPPAPSCSPPRTSRASSRVPSASRSASLAMSVFLSLDSRVTCDGANCCTASRVTALDTWLK